MTIKDVIQALENGQRFGASVDIPEGSRIVQFSDTLVGLMIDALKASNAEPRQFNSIRPNQSTSLSQPKATE